MASIVGWILFDQHDASSGRGNATAIFMAYLLVMERTTALSDRVQPPLPPFRLERRFESSTYAQTGPRKRPRFFARPSSPAKPGDPVTTVFAVNRITCGYWMPHLRGA
jgi:hypothetical protein